MKRMLSGLGIMIMLVFRYPPLPEFSIFHKYSVVETRCFTLNQVALQFGMN